MSRRRKRPKGAVTGIEAPAYAAEGHKSLCMAAVATHTQKTMLQTPAAQILVKLSPNVARRRPPVLGHLLRKRRVVLLDDPIWKRLLWAMALIAVRTPVRL